MAETAFEVVVQECVVVEVQDPSLRQVAVTLCRVFWGEDGCGSL